MPQRRSPNRLFWSLAAVVLIGAGIWLWGGERVPDTLRAFLLSSDGTLEIRVKDHREAIGDFAVLEVIVETIRIGPESGIAPPTMEWTELNPSPNTVDLTRFTGKDSARIFKGSLPRGNFAAIQVRLHPVTGTLKNNQKKVPVADLTSPIRLPFSIQSKVQTLIVLDLVVVDMSDHPPRAYELHVGGYELYTDGRLIARVPPA